MTNVAGSWPRWPQPTQEAALSRWAWWRGEEEAADLVLYLLNAAKLDYELRVFRERRAEIATASMTLDRELDQVLVLHASVSVRQSLASLASAQQRLIDAQASTSAMAIELTHLRALKRTVGIARRNLAMLTPKATVESDVTAESMFRRDQDLAEWLQDQIDGDVGYAEAILSRAKEAQALTSLRLSAVDQRIVRAQARVTLLQTSLTAALLAGIGVIAVLQLRVDVAPHVRIPLLVAFMSMLLALPVLAAHWLDRYRRIDHVAAMVFGAGAGWLVAAVVAGNADPVTSLIGIVIGAALGRAFTYWHDQTPEADDRDGHKGRGYADTRT